MAETINLKNVLVIKNITESYIDKHFHYRLPIDVPHIIFDNGTAIVFCRDENTTMTIYYSIYSYYERKEYGIEIEAYLENGQQYERSQLYIIKPDENINESCEDDDEEEDHPDLCQICRRDYVDWRGRCEYCRGR